VAAVPLRLLVVGEDALARAGLRAVAEGAGVTVVADVAPDQLGDDDEGDAFDAATWDLGPSPGSPEPLRGLAARLPVLAVLWGGEQARDALAAGARGVLLRERLEERLATAIRAVATGLVVIDEALSETVLRPPPAAPVPLVEPLTPREMEVLQLVTEGLTSRGIGQRLGISEHTAKFHVNAILGKLGAQNRSEAVALAARLGILVL
jgi:DNA-binding NarL/FixJ family response regulator